MEGRGTEEGSHKGRAKVLWIYMHALMGCFSCDGVQYVCEDNVHVYGLRVGYIVYCVALLPPPPPPPSGEPMAQSSGRGV